VLNGNTLCRCSFIARYKFKSEIIKKGKTTVSIAFTFFNVGTFLCSKTFTMSVSVCVKMVVIQIDHKLPSIESQSRQTSRGARNTTDKSL
jgi:hypothetical protein